MSFISFKSLNNDYADIKLTFEALFFNLTPLKRVLSETNKSNFIRRPRECNFKIISYLFKTENNRDYGAQSDRFFFAER